MLRLPMSCLWSLCHTYTCMSQLLHHMITHHTYGRHITISKPCYSSLHALTKNCTLSKVPLQSDHIINTSIKQVKTLHMELSRATSIPVYRPKLTVILPQKQQFGYVGFPKKNRCSSTETNQNWAQFQKAQLTPYKLGMYAFFFHSPPSQGVMSTNLLPVIGPRWSQVTHIATST